MTDPRTYSEVKDAMYILKMMEDSILRHHASNITKDDTKKLHNTLSLPIDAQEREKRYADMQAATDAHMSTLLPTPRDKKLDKALDLDARVSRDSYVQADYKDDDDIDSELDGLDISNLDV